MFVQNINISISIFTQMNGREMCELAREEFVIRTPGYAGDILYEHLIILQQDHHIDMKMENSSPPPPSVSIKKATVDFVFTSK